MVAGKFAVAALSLASVAFAAGHHQVKDADRFERRQAPSVTSRAASATQTRTGGGGGGGSQVASSPLASLTRIGTTTTSAATVALPTTFTAGASPPISGAPPLPAITALNPANYPALDVTPPIDSPEVQQWIKDADLANAPNIPPTGLNGCSNSTNAEALSKAGADGNCWWTCGGCTRATDITYCPTTEEFGLSYDDGPSPDTPRLLNLLAANDIKSTFFIVGSRAISRPEMLQTEYMSSHALSVHTWAHPPLTTLSNEQIVAELGWTKKIIKDVTGVTPNTMRPPYGDIDDRVRYIAMKMGLRPIIWTSYNGKEFDTQDWQIGAGVVNATTVYNNFENILGMAPSMPHGFIVLAHDLYQQSVDLAVNYILPQIISAGQLKLQPISQCLGEPLSNAYIETSDNKTALIQSSSTVVGASGTGFVSFAASTSSGSSSASTGSSAPSSSTSSASGSGSGSSTGNNSSGGSQPTSAANSVAVASGIVGAVIVASSLLVLA
ncbi:chitin deacetylase [Microbotryomycetes sp. JL201]|nr:chitin deacetylase [Microbotryomycetes sp. JL201]